MSKGMEAGKPPSLNSLKQKKTAQRKTTSSCSTGNPSHDWVTMEFQLSHTYHLVLERSEVENQHVSYQNHSVDLDMNTCSSILIHFLLRYKPFGACQSCYRSPLVTLGFLAPSCKEPGLLEPPWGSGASSAAWGKAVLLLWGCSLQWEVPGFFLFRFPIENMRHILLGGCATPLKHMSQLELFFPIYGKRLRFMWNNPNATLPAPSSFPPPALPKLRRLRPGLAESASAESELMEVPEVPTIYKAYVRAR